MPEASRPPENPFEGLIRPWFFPSLGLTVVVGVAVFWTSGLLSDSAVGALVAVLVPLGLALAALRTLAAPSLDGRTRTLVVAAAVLAFVVAAVPAYEAVHPGEPVLVAEFDQPGEAQAVPPGVDGSLLLLVSSRLGNGAEPSIAFRLVGFESPVEGELKRTTSFARVGRGGRAKVSHDHDADWFEARLPAGAKEIRLDRAQGLTSAPLRVEAFRDWIPHRIAWILSALVLALAAIAEARSGRDSGATIAVGAALGFGLVVSYNVTPAQAVVPSLWAILLGAIFGAPVAWLFRRVARGLVASAQRKDRPARGEG